MKHGSFAPFYYKKCGGKPPAIPKPVKPKSVPPPPKAPAQKKDWCKDFHYLRLTGSRTYYCMKCPGKCPAEPPKPPPRPAGVKKAPPPKSPERKNWCQENNWMKFGRHQEYDFTKCGGRPPKAPPKAPKGVEVPPKKVRKPWCVEHNYMRFKPNQQAFFYAKCGGLVPAVPKKPVTCPAFMPKITDANRGPACTDFAWMRTNVKLKDCYCSRCSCPAGPLVKEPPKNIQPAPAVRAQRGGWCKHYAYMRYGPDEVFYCQECGCSLPRKPLPPLPALAKIPKDTKGKQTWCEEHVSWRYKGGLKAVAYYDKCGGRPKPKPQKPANIPPPPPRKKDPESRKEWCEKQKFLLNGAGKDFYCSKCSCPRPPPPPPSVPKQDPNFCANNRFMIEGPDADYYYSKCGGRPKEVKVEKPKEKEEEVKPQEITIAPPKGNSKQVHVHVTVAAPKTKKSNSGLAAMVARVAEKNQRAAEKMDSILRKLRSQDCRGGNCIPQTHKDMEKWKADWILETEETGSIVP